MTGIDHILFGGIIIDKISGDHYDIRIRLLHFLHIFFKSFSVKRRSHMRIRKLNDTQRSGLFLRMQCIWHFPYMISKEPSTDQITGR